MFQNQKPEEALYYNKRGFSSLGGKNLEKALADLEKAVLIEPICAEFRIDFADALADARKYDEAKKGKN